MIGSNDLRVSSAGFAFDHETVKAVLSSVTMADSGSAGDIDTSDNWLDGWSGDWYGWWLMMDGTGAYEAVGEGVWDACARIEVRENMTGYLTLWDEDGNSDTLIAGIEPGFANSDDTPRGVMSCEGGRFLSDSLESGDWIVEPSALSDEQLIEFRGGKNTWTKLVHFCTASCCAHEEPSGTIWTRASSPPTMQTGICR